MVYDIVTNPKGPALLATITGSVPSGDPPDLYAFQVVGNRLFALDTNSESVLAFNFDVAHSTLQPTGCVRATNRLLPLRHGRLAHGELIHLPINNPDMITVLDANLLAGGEPPLVTTIATGIWPNQVA